LRRRLASVEAEMDLSSSQILAKVLAMTKPTQALRLLNANTKCHLSSMRDMVLQTERALERIDAKTYGLCEDCGAPIGKARLQVFPRATLCMICKQKGRAALSLIAPPLSRTIWLTAWTIWLFDYATKAWALIRFR
jgi:hypothetical protein